jgi:hypothetical protein
MGLALPVRPQAFALLQLFVHVESVVHPSPQRHAAAFSMASSWRRRRAARNGLIDRADAAAASLKVACTRSIGQCAAVPAGEQSRCRRCRRRRRRRRPSAVSFGAHPIDPTLWYHRWARASSVPSCQREPPRTRPTAVLNEVPGDVRVQQEVKYTYRRITCRDTTRGSTRLEGSGLHWRLLLPGGLLVMQKARC